MKYIFNLILVFCFVFSYVNAQDNNQMTASYTKTSISYKIMQHNLCKGWNTWDTESVLNHVLLPDYLAIDFEFEDYNSHTKIRSPFFIGNDKNRNLEIKPGLHTYDGSFTSVIVKWGQFKFNLRTAHQANDFVALIEPLNQETQKNLHVIACVRYMWNMCAQVSLEGDHIETFDGVTKHKIYMQGGSSENSEQRLKKSLKMGYAYVSSGKNRTKDEIYQIISLQESKARNYSKKFGDLQDAYNAMKSVQAWNLIYDHWNKRAIVPVSRFWNCGRGGWVLFLWDTYFSACCLSVDNKELAYSNAINVTKGITPGGFVPNGRGQVSENDFDRSQPPVGSISVLQIYNRWKEKWFLVEVFDELLSWNRWWNLERNKDGYLCWGSNNVPETWLNLPSRVKIGNGGRRQDAKFESGLDNSPMYLDAEFDSQFKGHTGLLLLGDVGLMGLYVADCKALITIAKEIGRDEVVLELEKRSLDYSRKLLSMFSNKKGIFLNYDIAKQSFSSRLSPTLFYPLIGHVASEDMLSDMLIKHFYNTNEFYGDYMLPSISWNDPSYENDYWKGRTWAPMNYLTYLGLRAYSSKDAIKARKDLASKSLKLLLNEWLKNGYVFENYNSKTGDGYDVHSSDPFYQWGGLLGLIALMEAGF